MKIYKIGNTRIYRYPWRTTLITTLTKTRDLVITVRHHRIKKIYIQIMRINYRSAERINSVIDIDDVYFWGKWENNQGGMHVQWNSDRRWGELYIWKENDKIYIDTENTGKDYAIQILKEVVKRAIEKE